MATHSELLALMREHAALLQGSAEAIAQSLATGAALGADEGLSEALKAMLLAESADSSEAAGARRRTLRNALAEEVYCCVALTREASQLVADWDLCPHDAANAPPVHVELRGTAGRSVDEGAFVVGSAAVCDIQAVGDPTVLPVHCIVVPLPETILIADFWSGGSTRRIRPEFAHEPASPAPPLAQRAAFVVDRSERVVLRIGAKTTITLGPPSRSVATRRSAAASPHVPKAAELEATKPRSRSRGGRYSDSSTSVGSASTDADFAAVPLQAQEPARLPKGASAPPPVNWRCLARGILGATTQAPRDPGAVVRRQRILEPTRDVRIQVASPLLSLFVLES
eukprot:CAMPEP_0198617016 /NCGR_PEP_ID=MMETSP1462-20131121/160181_1 /TAXON_ID=1333877 /ORGANISM="Brandtodinium nutriculum, Strain RCC3387" /LENGTH=339 /DNA_ID=CAMNT_0044348815 /DNA_START=27 /DNA_END=1045 /DNA_ORIENTATION=+